VKHPARFPCKSPRIYHSWCNRDGGIWDGDTCARCGASLRELQLKLKQARNAQKRINSMNK